MTDIIIVRRRSLAHITGASNKGMVWIMENIETGRVQVKFTIASELVDDVVGNMKEDKLDVDIQ